MSTQLTFDLDGLRRAIESGDAGYRATLYADGAEVHITDADHPAQAAQTFQGRSAIASWLVSMHSANDTHRVLESQFDFERVSLVEERETADGVRIVYASSAAVDQGLIIEETGFLTANVPTAAQPPAEELGATDRRPVMIDQSPSSAAAVPAVPVHSSGARIARHVPGYYLG